MAGRIETRLKELDIVLPAAPAPVAAYVGWLRTGNIMVTAGQLPVEDGKMVYQGRVGEECTEEDGIKAARICVINCLAQLQAALASEDKELDAITRIVRLEGYVHSAPGYYNQPKVINGASQLLVDVFGEVGRHTRVALGIYALPLNAAVEVCLWAEVAD